MLADTFDNNNANSSGALSPYYFPEIPAVRGSRRKTGAGDNSIRPNSIEKFQCADICNTKKADGSPPSADTAEQAYQKGLQKGKKEAREKQRLKTASAVKGLGRATAALEQIREKKKIAAEIETIRRSLAAAKQIIEKEIEVNPEIVRNVAASALHRVADIKGIVIRVNPLDLETLMSFKKELRAMFKADEDFQMEQDSTIARGGCIIDTAFGDIDASIDSQLKAIEDAFGAHLPDKKSKG